LRIIWTVKLAASTPINMAYFINDSKHYNTMNDFHADKNSLDVKSNVLTIIMIYYYIIITSIPITVTLSQLTCCKGTSHTMW